MTSLSQYNTGAESISLGKIDGTPFTIVSITDSDYEGNAGVIIETQEHIEIDGNKVNRFHTTRKAVVNTLSNEQLRKDLESGQVLGPVVCIKKKTKAGFPVFVLQDFELEAKV